MRHNARPTVHAQHFIDQVNDQSAATRAPPTTDYRREFVSPAKALAGREHDQSPDRVIRRRGARVP